MSRRGHLSRWGEDVPPAGPKRTPAAARTVVPWTSQSRSRTIFRSSGGARAGFDRVPRERLRLHRRPRRRDRGDDPRIRRGRRHRDRDAARRALPTTGRLRGMATMTALATIHVGEPDIPAGLTISEYRRTRPRRIPGGAASSRGRDLMFPPRGGSRSAGERGAWSGARVKPPRRSQHRGLNAAWANPPATTGRVPEATPALRARKLCR
jgi:hypothetical protein